MFFLIVVTHEDLVQRHEIQRWTATKIAFEVTSGTSSVTIGTRVIRAGGCDATN
jgi:hypothetical protein